MLTPKSGGDGHYSSKNMEESSEAPAVHSAIPPQEERVSIEDVPF